MPPHDIVVELETGLISVADALELANCTDLIELYDLAEDEAAARMALPTPLPAYQRELAIAV